MQTFRERAIELAQDCKNVKSNKVYMTLASEYNIGKRTAGDRFKSLFGMPIREYINKRMAPSKEQAVDLIIQNNTLAEFRKSWGYIDSRRLSILFNEYFGTSNYFKIKLSLKFTDLIEQQNATLSDNESILISQHLGDGHMERNNSFKLEHGYKQYDYLKFKVKLFNKAYPTTNDIGGIKRRDFMSNDKPYVSYTWRTHSVLHKQCEKLLSYTLEEMVNKLTPFGVMLYFLDDGWFSKSHIKGNKWTYEVGLSMGNEKQRIIFIEYFASYGHHFNLGNKTITLRSQSSIISFLRDFIEPFADMIPKCMHYKFYYKDIVGNA